MDRNEDECTRCPTNCGEVESHLHYLSCEIVNKTSISKVMRSELLKWLRKSKTDPRLIILINRIIGNISKNNKEPLDPERWDDEEIRETIRQQNDIGIREIFKGRLSKMFRKIQDDYYDKLRDRIEETGVGKLSKKFSGSWWVKGIIKQLIFYSLNLWQIRNEFAHEDDEEKKRNEELLKIKNEIIKWYRMRDEFDKETRHLFRVTLFERCMKDTRMNEAWLRTVRLAYRKIKETVSD